MSIVSGIPFNHLILCCPLLLCLQSFPASGSFPMSQLFASRGPKYCSFSFSISPSNSGLISFRIDWLDLLAVQGTLKSLLQHHSSKASILQCSAFLQPNSHTHIFLLEQKKNPSFDYTDLHQQSNVSTFYLISRFVIAFLPRCMHLLISWL